VTIDTASGVAIGPLEELFSLKGGDGAAEAGQGFLAADTGFDVTADGQQFLLLRESTSGGTAAPRMILVQNWRQMLQGR
jgi:hypothetical protein